MGEELKEELKVQMLWGYLQNGSEMSKRQYHYAWALHSLLCTPGDRRGAMDVGNYSLW